MPTSTYTVYMGCELVAVKSPALVHKFYSSDCVNLSRGGPLDPVDIFTCN